MPITNAPPLRTPSTSTKATTSSKVPTVTESREEALNGLGQIVQLPLIGFKLHADAGAVGLYWPPIAKEISKLADGDERIAHLIDPLIKIGPYTALIAAALPFFAQLAVNHGMI